MKPVDPNESNEFIWVIEIMSTVLTGFIALSPILLIGSIVELIGDIDDILVIDREGDRPS